LGREKAGQSDEQARKTGGQQESLVGFGGTHDIHPSCNDRLSDLEILRCAAERSVCKRTCTIGRVERRMAFAEIEDWALELVL
jgi:hypothetical protein